MGKLAPAQDLHAGDQAANGRGQRSHQHERDPDHEGGHPGARPQERTPERGDGAKASTVSSFATMAQSRSGVFRGHTRPGPALPGSRLG